MSLSTAAIGGVAALAMIGAGVWYVTGLQAERDEAVNRATVSSNALGQCNAGVKARHDASLASLAAASAAEAKAAEDRQAAEKAAGELQAGVGAGLSCSAAVARSKKALGAKP
jgi:hypothetical protein